MWFAEDGLMRLDQHDSQGPYPGQSLATVLNQNGIYFRAINELLKARSVKIGLAQDLGIDFIEAAQRLEHPERPGMILRHAGDYFPEAQDNPAGICAGCALYEEKKLPRRIYQFGVENGFFYYHDKERPWEPKYQRQGGEIAYYAICCAYSPDPWFFIWFLAGLLVSAFSQKNVSNAQLAWVRIEGVTHALQKYSFARFVAPLFYLTKFIWRLRIKKLYGHELGPIRDYYADPTHPNRVLAQKLIEEG